MGLEEKLSFEGPSRGTQAIGRPGDMIGPPCLKGK
jgi:hypothetical protein